MVINESKFDRQVLALDKWRNAKGIGRIIHPTGFGKTYEMLLLLDKFFKKNPTKIAIIVVNNVASKENFHAALSSVGSMFDNIIKSNLLIETKTSMIKRGSILTTDLLIVDEIHDFVSKEAYNVINGNIISYKYIAGFTGTDVDSKNYDKLNKVCPVVDYISYSEAKDKGWISDFIEYNFGIEFNKKDRELYEEYSGFITYTLKVFNNNFDSIRYCANGRYSKEHKKFIGDMEYCSVLAKSKGWHRDIDISIPFYKRLSDVYSPTNIHNRAVKFMHIVKERNKLMDSNALKVKATVDIARLFIPKKTIIFNNNISFIDVVHEILNSKSRINTLDTFDKMETKYKPKIYLEDSIAVKFHSKVEKLPILTSNGFIKTLKGKVKTFGKTAQFRMALEKIKSGQSTILLGVKAFDSSVNIEDLEVVIITGGSNNPLQQKQRAGRGLRKSEYKKLSYIINIYFKNTRDEYKLLERQKDYEHTIKTITHIKELI